MKLKERLARERLILDGGSGTMLTAAGLPAGTPTEKWNLQNPDAVEAVNLAYFKAGSQIVCANTFGTNPLKYDADTLENMIRNALGAAQNARRRAGFSAETHYIALDIGPLGQLLSPFGNLLFEDALAAFAQVVRLGVRYGADLIFIETMNDCLETKAAVLAAKENCDLPVFAANVYDERGRLMTGADVQAMVAMLEGLRVDALGMNCSLGPEQMLNLLPEFLRVSSTPVIVKPNAGIPKSQNNETVYTVNADEFSEILSKAAKAGAGLVGGCCGTTPEYIRKTVSALDGIPYTPPAPKSITCVSSYTDALVIGDEPILIGERINPTGKPKLKEALRTGNIGYVLREGIAEAEYGAHALDVNAGLPDIDEPAVLTHLVRELQAVCALPLQLDSNNPKALEAAMRAYSGKPLVNSVCGKQSAMDAVFPLIQKYGGVVVALAIDENGIPDSARGRADIIAKIAKEAEKYGISRKDILADPLTLTVSADPQNAARTLEALRIIRNELSIHTTLGVSNISFGLPARDMLNSSFFAMALEAGLNAAIMNPFSAEMMSVYYARRALCGLDEGCRDYIAFAKTYEQSAHTISSVSSAASAAVPTEDTDSPLRRAIVKGLKIEAKNAAGEMLAHIDALKIINKEIIPALDEVGRGFEQKTVYLPELLMSAEAASAAFEAVKAAMPKREADNGQKVLLATVAGDIHDIGKNIVRVLLENFGFNVIDLGRDVPPEVIVEAAKTQSIRLVGLSALMTTTVPAMERTIRLLRADVPNARVIVGGAVLTADYAKTIGADFYAADAMETVRIAEALFTKRS